MNSSFFNIAILSCVSAGLICAASGAPVKFEQNQGQTSAAYSFLAKARGHTLFLGQDHTLIELHGKDRQVASVRMRFAGADADSKWIPAGELAGRASYFVGKDRGRWVHEAPQYTKLERKDVYPGVDLVLYGDGGNVEYDLTLGPGVNPSRIRLQFDSPWPARVRGDGAIEIETTAGTLLQKTPAIYQQRNGQRDPVRGRFVAAGKNQFRLVLEKYDHSRPLVVDPVIESASYYGGELDDQVIVTGVDYVAGNTSSVDFENTLQTRRGRDVFLQFSVYGTNASGVPAYYVFGGSGDDTLTSAAPAISGVSVSQPENYLYLAGVTNSADLPVTVTTGPGSRYGGGNTDGFVVQFAMTRGAGNLPVAVVGMAYWGGSGDDRINSIAEYGYQVAITGSTTSPDMPTQATTQTELAGAQDAFVAIFDFNNNSLYIPFSSYLGGSGDDTGWAIQKGPQGLYVAGETHSADFPVAGSNSGSLSGPSDGFFAQLLLTADGTAYYWGFARFIGGSGDDSIRALGVTPPTIYGYSPQPLMMAITGTTSSPDFPVLNAAQPKLGGGTDAFIMGYMLATDQIAFATYWGGSGNDSGTAASVRGQQQIIAAGNTSSIDFPALNPVQPSLGGGQDGFLVLLSNTGQVQFSSYYGGSGDENVYSVVPLGGLFHSGPTRLGGDTTSPDLPGVQGLQKDGGVDGFTADIGVPLIVVPSTISVAKGTYYALTPQVSQTPGHLFSIQTLDASKVRLVDRDSNTLVDQILVGSSTSVAYIEAQQDNGQGQIQVSVDGFPSQIVTVEMFPLIVVPAFPSATTYTIWSPPAYVDVQFCAFNQAANTVAACGATRPQLTPSIKWVSTNPAVAQVNIDSAGDTTLQFGVRGTATISMQSSVPIQEPSSFTVTVTGASASAPSQLTLGKDLVEQFYLSNSQTPTYLDSNNILVTTSDPTLVGLMSNIGSTAPPLSQLTIPVSSFSLAIVALADHGQATITLSCPDWDSDIVTVVQLVPTYLSVSPATENAALGSLASVGLTLLWDGLDPRYFYQLAVRPGAAPIPVQITSSNPAVASPASALVNFAPPSDYGVNSNSYQILTNSLGTATISVQSVPPGLKDIRGTETISVVASPPPPPVLTLQAQLSVGKDLEAPLYPNYYGSNASQLVTYTIADPAMALVSPDGVTPGTGQASVQAYNRVFIQGLAASGSTQLTVTAADGTTIATMQINLTPSGFGFSVNQVKFGLNDPVPPVSWQAFSLDPVTLFPVASMAVRPGLALNLPVTINGSSVTIPSATWMFPNPSPSTTLGIQAVATGITTLTMGTPDGFTAVPRRSTLNIDVVQSTVSLSNYVAVQNAMVKTQLGGAASAGTVQLTSGDPTRLLFSNTTSGPGSSSITVSPGQQGFYLIGLANSGSVAFHASGAGFNPVDDTIQMSPLIANLSSGQYPNSMSLSMQTGTPPSNMTLGVSAQAATVAAIAPGVTLTFPISSSSPGVASLASPTVSLSGLTISTPVPVTAVTPGSTVITASQPSGVTALNSSVTVSVQEPQLTLVSQNYSPNLQISQDLELGVNLTLVTPAQLLNNSIVQVTSLNPDLVLLSQNLGSPGSSSASVAFTPNGGPETFFLQALAGAGTAQIQISSDGFQTSTVTVTLMPLSFIWNGSTSNTPQALVGNPSFYSLVAGGFGSQFRPGAPTYSIPLAVDPPAAATLSPDTLTFGPSGYLSVTTYVTATTPGSFTLLANLPDGTTAQQAITAVPPPLAVNCPVGYTLGKDLYISCNTTVQSAVPISVTSSDPTLLLVSSDQTQLGAVNAILNPQPYNSINFYVQALAASGQPAILVQAPGYADTTIKFTLAGSGFTVTTSLNVAPAGATQITLPASLVLSPYSMSVQGIFGTQEPIRPGAAPITITANSSAPGTVAVAPPSLVFQGGDSTKQFNLTPGVSGTSIVTLTAPQGYTLQGTSVFLFSVP